MSNIKLHRNTNENVRIAQISDIHWRGQQRHEEYTLAFEKLFTQLKEQDVHAIVCTGDTFHTKTQNITPEIIDKLVWMLRELAKIAPLHFILGNHDGNLANEDRQDAISPLINAMGGGYRTYFYKNSGTYPLITKTVVSVENNQTWTQQESLVQSGWLSVYSLFDKEGWDTIEPKSESDFFDIALFHGSINGCLTDGDFQMTECDMDVSFFQKYDLVMLGDIHKQQFLGWRANGGDSKDMKPWIGYPGSLIQQDYGELEKKGWYLWTLNPGGIQKKRKWSVDFVELPNEMPFVTTPWVEDVPTTVKGLLEARNNNVKNHRVRISTKQNISQLETSLLYKEIREKLGAVEVAFKQEKQDNITTIETDTVSVSKRNLCSDSEALYKLYLEYVKNSNGKHVLNEAQLKKAEEYIVDYVKRLAENLEDDVTRDVIWSLKGMKFSNLYRYGEGNTLNFQNMNGIINISGPNRIGKSSIVGSLMYGLYNTTDRASVKSAQIINRKKKEGSASILINVGGTDYLIERKTSKIASKKRPVEDEDKALTSLQLYRLTPNGKTVELNPENDIKRSDTDKIVRRLIGSSEDFLMTAFSSQNDINRFIKAGPTVRKEILNRFLDLDIFKKLFLFADKDFSDIESKIGRYNLAEWETTMFQLKKQSEEKTLKIDTLRLVIEDFRSDLEDKKLWLKNNQVLNQQDLYRQTKSLEGEVVSLQKEINRLNKSLEATIVELEKSKKELDILQALIVKEDTINFLRNTIELLQKARKSLSEMKSVLNADKTKVDSMKKSVRKLDTVPCGDSFPECRFIHDSHEDKKNLAATEASVEVMVEALAAAEKNVRDLENENYEDRLRIHTQRLQTLAMLQQKIPSSEKEINLLTNNLNVTAEILITKEVLVAELREKLDTINNTLFEERVIEAKTLEKLISSKDQELQNILISLGMDKNKISQMDGQKEECKILLEQLKVYDSVREAFSKNGIPAMVLKTQLPAINMELNKILSGVVDFTVSLETEMNGVNTLDVFITDAHDKRVGELASGMEEMIISLALRVALINLSSLPKPDFLIIDEGFGALDAENRATCMRLLTLLKERFKAILIISHFPEIKGIADKIIEIKNVNGESLVQA